MIPRCNKYIIIETMGNEVPLIFPEFIDHSAMAEGRRVVSAGFCMVYFDEDYGVTVRTNGNSSTLNINPRPEDAEIIKNLLVVPQF